MSPPSPSSSPSAPAARLHGLKAPAPLPCINEAALRLTRQFQKGIFDLKKTLASALTVPPDKACRLVTLTAAGKIEVRRLCEYPEIPEWSLTAICGYAIVNRRLQITPRPSDVLFLVDLGGPVKLTRIPNVVRSWIDFGHYTGLYASLPPAKVLELVEHFHKTLGAVPHPDAYEARLVDAIKTHLRDHLGRPRGQRRPGRPDSKS